MIVMGGIVGSGIFINPYVVALHVHTPFLILGVWCAGGLLALMGAFIWAELATRLPGAGGNYLYLRVAYQPSVAFLYGWVLLLVTQTGGMAAVAVTFARYWREITGMNTSDSVNRLPSPAWWCWDWCWAAAISIRCRCWISRCRSVWSRRLARP